LASTVVVFNNYFIITTKTFTVFFVSLVAAIVTILFSRLEISFGEGNHNKTVALLASLAFGVSIAGLVVSIEEIRRSRNAKKKHGIYWEFDFCWAICIYRHRSI
jgi:hypothetical protein